MSTSDTRYACQAPPDIEFYTSTFKADNIAGKQLVRGLHTYNEMQHMIDDACDKVLR